MKNLRKGLVFSMVLLSVISLGSVAGTYAKYTSTATGTDRARVAKWSFTVGGTETTTSETFTFDLFSTTYDNVESKDSNNVIAPGTEGQFTIALQNNSEVNAVYTIDYTVSNEGGIPVEFSIDGTNWTTTLADVSETAINMDAATSNITVRWRWAFTGDVSSNYTGTQTDTTDTALGNAATPAVLEVSAKVTATQVD